jgi:hypothetical protein
MQRWRDPCSSRSRERPRNQVKSSSFSFRFDFQMGFFELEIIGILLLVSVLVVFEVLELIVGILGRLPQWVNRMGVQITFGFL